jgi:hypothetical protein
LKAVDNYGIEKSTPYETIFEPPFSFRKLPETGFLMVSLPELNNCKRYWLEIWNGCCI